MFWITLKTNFHEVSILDNFVKLIACESGDWMILEINGVEWASGHRIDENDWLGLLSEHFDCQIGRECISDEEMELRC